MRPKGEFCLNERVMEGSEEDSANTVDGKPKSPLKQITRSHSLRMKHPIGDLLPFVQVNGACSHDEALILKPNKAVVGSLIEYDIKPVKKCYEKTTKDIVCQNTIETSRYSQSFTESSTKTYSRKKYSLDNHLVESFGLPDEPILDTKVRDKLDAEVGESSEINLYSVNYLNSPWRISSLESDTLLDKTKEIRFKANPDVVQKKIKKIVTNSNNESSRDSSGVETGEMYTSTPNTNSKKGSQKIKVLSNKINLRNLYKSEQNFCVPSTSVESEINGVRKGYKKVVFHNRNGVLQTRYFYDKKVNLKGEGSSDDKLVNSVKSDSNSDGNLINSAENLVNQVNIDGKLNDSENVSNCQVNNDQQNTKEETTPSTRKQRSLRKTDSENDLINNVTNNVNLPIENDNSQENNNEFDKRTPTRRRKSPIKTKEDLVNNVSLPHENSKEETKCQNTKDDLTNNQVPMNNVINNVNLATEDKESQEDSNINLDRNTPTTRSQRSLKKVNSQDDLINNISNNVNLATEDKESQENSNVNLDRNTPTTRSQRSYKKVNCQDDLINNVNLPSGNDTSQENTRGETNKTTKRQKSPQKINNVTNTANVSIETDKSQENKKEITKINNVDPTIDSQEESDKTLTTRSQKSPKKTDLLNNVNLPTENEKSQENSKESDKKTPKRRRKSPIKTREDLANNEVLTNNESQENSKEETNETTNSTKDLINNVTNTANSQENNKEKSDETPTTRRQRSLKKTNGKNEIINNVTKTANLPIDNDKSQESNKETDKKTPTTRRKRSPKKTNTKHEVINNVNLEENSKQETNKTTEVEENSKEFDEKTSTKRRKSPKKTVNLPLENDIASQENSKAETDNLNDSEDVSNCQVNNDQQNTKEETDSKTPLTRRQRNLRKTNSENDLINVISNVDQERNKEESVKTPTTRNQINNVNLPNENEKSEENSKEKSTKTKRQKSNSKNDSSIENDKSQENSKQTINNEANNKLFKTPTSEPKSPKKTNDPPKRILRSDKTFKSPEFLTKPEEFLSPIVNTKKTKPNASYIEEIAQVLDLEVESSHSKNEDIFKVEEEDVVFTLSNSQRTSFFNKSKELSQNSNSSEKSSPKKFRSASLLSIEHQKLIEAVRSPSPRRNRSQSYNDSNSEENNLDRSKALTKSHEEHLHLLETIKAKGESFFVKDKRVNGDIDEESKKVIHQILMNDIKLIEEPKRRLRSSEKQVKADSTALKQNGITSEIRIMIKPMDQNLDNSKEDKENHTSVNCQSNKDNEKAILGEIPLTDGLPNVNEEFSEPQVEIHRRKSLRVSKVAVESTEEIIHQEKTRRKSIRLSKLDDSVVKNTDQDQVKRSRSKEDSMQEKRRTRSKLNDECAAKLDQNETITSERKRDGSKEDLDGEKIRTRSNEPKEKVVKDDDDSAVKNQEKRRTRSKETTKLAQDENIAQPKQTEDNEASKNRRKSLRISKIQDNAVIDLTQVETNNKTTKINSVLEKNVTAEVPIMISSEDDQNQETKKSTSKRKSVRLTSLEKNIASGEVTLTVVADKPVEAPTEVIDKTKQNEDIVILDSTTEETTIIENPDLLQEPDIPEIIPDSANESDQNTDIPSNQSSPSSVKILDNFKITIDLTKLTNQPNHSLLVDLPEPLDIPDPLALDPPTESTTKEITKPSDLSELAESVEINLAADGVTISRPTSVDIENTDKVISTRKSQRLSKVEESRLARRSRRSTCEQKVKYVDSSTEDDTRSETDTDEDLSLAELANKEDKNGDEEKHESVAVKIKEEPEDVKFDNVHHELHEIVWTRIGGYPFWPSLIVADPVRNEHVRQNPSNKLIEYHVRFFADNGRRAWCRSGNLMKYVNKDDLSVLREKLSRRVKRRKIAMSNVLEACIIKSNRLPKWQQAVDEAESLKDKSEKEKVAFFEKFCEVKPKIVVDEEKKVKRKRESNILAPRKKFKSLRDDEPLLSRVRRRRRSENESSDDNESKVSDSSSTMAEALSIQAALFNRNKLFRKVGKEKVCQVCLKAGEVYKCKGRCGGVFHYQCALDFVGDKVGEERKNGEREQLGKKKQRVKSLVTADVHVENVEEQSVNVSENVNTEVVEEHKEVTENVNIEVVKNVSENVNMESVENDRKEDITENANMEVEKQEDVTIKVPTDDKEVVTEPKNLISQDITEHQNGEPHTPNSSLVEEIQLNCQKAVKQNGYVQIITIHSLINNTPPRKTFPPDYRNMSLAEQIDYKMKEIMKKFGDKPRYASTTDSSSDEKPVKVPTEEIKEIPVQPINEENHVDAISEEKKENPVEASNEENPIGPINVENKENTDEKAETIKEVNVDESLDHKDEEVEKSRKKKKGRPLKRQSNELDEGIMHVTADADIPSSPKLEEVFDSVNFKCGFCLENQIPFCNACNKAVSPSGSNSLQKCAAGYCGKYYHQECLKMWPQTQWMLTQTVVKDDLVDAFQCPIHVCHTCSSEDPRMSYLHRCSSDKLVRCLRCPASYHLSNFCVPAGTQILSQSQIICPRHIKQHKKTQVFNANWCFLCSETGTLICCEFCPMSAHQECLSKKYDSDEDYICEDCQSGKMPLYDEIVWCKLGHYRWWPGVILYPQEIPEKIKKIPHHKGEFVVKFYGTYDHYWFSKGRVFQFADDDTAECSSHKQSIDIRFGTAVQEALSALKIKREFKQMRLKKKQRDNKPPPYIKLKVNKPVGNVRQFDPNLSNTAPCECDPKAAYPCGPDSDCLNRILLTECDPDVCPAGERCCNQCFEKKQYPPLVPYKTESRGWGLKTLAPIKKGQFVIEYVGELIDDAEYQRRIARMHESKDENYYFLIIEKDRMLDAGPKGNVARFMNHSCNPNCETQKWTVNGDTRVGLFASEPIAADTELTFNYNLQCVGEEKKVCMCGAPNCSGFIGAKIKRAPKKFKRKYKKKKKLVIPQTVQKLSCTICGRKGADQSCNNKFCNKSYHLRCLKLDEKPTGKFICPWHNCNVCTRRTARCCIKCINSYCPQHSEGNIRYYPQAGFLCSEHCKDEDTKEETTKKTVPADVSTTSSETSDEEDNISLSERLKQTKKKKHKSSEDDEETSSQSDSPTVNGKRSRRSSGNENRFRKKAKIVAHGTSKVTTSKKLRKKLSQSVIYSSSDFDKSTTIKRAKHRDTL